jgi:hypothetical protein
MKEILASPAILEIQVILELQVTPGLLDQLELLAT